MGCNMPNQASILIVDDESSFRKSLSDILEEKGITNILEIAAGLSPRSLIMTENPEINYIATDLPDILKEVKEIHKMILGDKKEANITFQTLDIFNKNQLLKIVSSFPDDGKPIAITMEGLLVYLNEEEKKKVAENIREALLKRNGFWITTDFMIKWAISENDEKARKDMRDKVNSTTKRVMWDNLFENEAEIKTFLELAGFVFEKVPHTDMLDELFCLQNPKLNLDREKIRHYLSDKCTYILSAKI